MTGTRVSLISLHKSKDLKSYDKILSMAGVEEPCRNNTIIELNRYPIDYYNKFNEEWNIVNSGSRITLKGISASEDIWGATKVSQIAFKDSDSIWYCSSQIYITG